MSISTAIGTAFSGLRATQAGMDVVSQNVANSGTVGYTRRTLTTVQQVSGTRTTGVQVVGAQRVLDTLLQRQLRLENAGAGYTGVKAAMTSSLEASFDPTGGTGSLSSLVSAYGSSLQALATNPASYAARAGVVSAASTLASTLNSLSGDVQDLRQNAEDNLSLSVGKANAILGQIQSVNGRILSDATSGGSAALLDQRDGLVDQLSEYLDLKVATSSSGAMTISTTGGLQLFDGSQATQLSFDTHSPLGAPSAYSTDPSRRGVGTITATSPSGGRTDVLAGGLIRSGSIAAYVEMRDEVLPQAQGQIDALAAGLASSLSGKGVAGTAATSGAASGYDLDLSSLQNGDTFKLTVASGGTSRTVTFVKAGSAAAASAASSRDGSVVGLDFSGGMAVVAGKVATILGSGFTVSNPSGSTLRVLDDGSAGTTDVTALSGTATVTGTASGSPQLPLFVDGGGGVPYTGSYEAGSQFTGFAGRIAINPSVLADNGTLVAYASSTSAGDATRPSFLIGQLTGAAMTFTGSSGIGGSTGPFTGTLGDYADQIIATQAANANAATSLDDGQKVALNAVQGRYSDSAGVNIDTEMTQLIQLQTAYGANARVMTAAKQMLDTLMAVGA